MTYSITLTNIPQTLLTSRLLPKSIDFTDIPNTQQRLEDMQDFLYVQQRSLSKHSDTVGEEEFHKLLAQHQ